MSTHEVWRVLRRRWWILLGLAVVAALAALLYSLAQPPTYRARTELVVLPSRADLDLNQYLEARMRTFRAVVLAFPQIDPTLPADLDQRTYVQILPEEGRIVIEVADGVPQQAAELANGLAGRLQRWVAEQNAAQAGTDRINVSTLVPAEVPASPYRLRIVINALAGLVLGLALGLPAAFLWEALDDTLGDASLARARLDIPVWPVLLPSPQKGPAVDSDPGGRVAAAWQRLYTGLRFPGREGPAAWRTLAVCGARAQDLPPAFLARLGAAIAQGGGTVLLVDACFREPALHTAFGLRAGPGLGEWLRAGEEGAPPVVPTEQRGLLLLPAGEALPPAAQAVALRRAAKAWPALPQATEATLVRLPDPVSTPEGLFLAARAEAVLLVAPAGRARLRHVRRALEALHSAQAHVLGLALWEEERGD